MKAVAAFLDPAHHDWWHRISAWSRDTLAPRAEAPSDEAARRDAKDLLRLLGEAGWLRPLATEVRM